MQSSREHFELELSEDSESDEESKDSEGKDSK